MKPRVSALACAVATVLTPTSVSAAPQSPHSGSGIYRLTCRQGVCVVDVDASAAAITAAARPVLAEMLAAVPESVVVDGTVVRRPDLDTVVEQFRAHVAAEIRRAKSHVGDDTGGAAALACSAGANVSYAKNKIDMVFYTQSYYLNLGNIDAISCSPTGTSLERVVWCASFGVVGGFPMTMTGSGPAFRIDGTFTDLCVYSMTPSAVGPLPNTLVLARVALGVNSWAVIGPERVQLDD